MLTPPVWIDYWWCHSNFIILATVLSITGKLWTRRVLVLDTNRQCDWLRKHTYSQGGLSSSWFLSRSTLVLWLTHPVRLERNNPGCLLKTRYRGMHDNKRLRSTVKLLNITHLASCLSIIIPKSPFICQERGPRTSARSLRSLTVWSSSIDTNKTKLCSV